MILSKKWKFLYYELKKGDLNGFRVHKFKMGNQLILMAYKLESDSLILY